ncbi:ROK family transcriptional regulator [Roseateles violae]|uniref:ROK family transcriptional regulator n=1 Tax=Roseateles violae TaxID=3058042 RepID=A0ABT8DZX4_9BURK|nr:ROK family transcriptional regulator [Pelomonas sp. PFR6]MDN3923161.1 ROK family transcriptional regulator [Pelomonas sp. PFR6]
MNAATPAPPAAPPITGDQRLVKNINRIALLRLMREEEGLSRADLSERSGLTRSTVSLLVKELIDEGWLRENEVVVSKQLGRRPTPLQLDGQRFVLVGAELTPDTIRVVTTSIRGEVLEAQQAALRRADPEGACQQLVEMIAVLVRRVVGEGRELLGIGVGLPGAVDSQTGMLLFAPNIGWRNVPVGERLRAVLEPAGLSDVPVHYQNEADLAAIGETQFGPRPPADPLVYISCGVGLGSGIVLGDTLFTGATGAGGEIGHTTLHPDGRPCSCGRRGCAEAYIGLRAIASEAGTGGQGALPLDREALKAAMAARQARARTAFEAAGRNLGVLLQNIWTTFDPRSIVLGGEAVALGGNDFVDAALQVLADYAAAAGVRAPTVRLARYTELAVAVGGAGYALYTLMQPYQAALQQQR